MYFRFCITVFAWQFWENECVCGVCVCVCALHEKQSALLCLHIFEFQARCESSSSTRVCWMWVSMTTGPMRWPIRDSWTRGWSLCLIIVTWVGSLLSADRWPRTEEKDRARGGRLTFNLCTQKITLSSHPNAGIWQSGQTGSDWLKDSCWLICLWLTRVYSRLLFYTVPEYYLSKHLTYII